jgi:hypothetical protein
MANLVIDRNRLIELAGGRENGPSADRLFRDGDVFFVGGELPTYDTLVTMFDSHCLEATSLFFLTFGPRESYAAGIEMARQIRKNFHVRLMAGIDQTVEPVDIERIYAAGVDNLVISIENGIATDGALPASLVAARKVFPKWGVGAALALGDGPAASYGSRIDRLLGEGIVPLVTFSSRPLPLAPEVLKPVLDRLVAAWEEQSVPLSAYLPLVKVMTPLVDSRPAGPVRGFIDRLHDQRKLVGSALRRHLRVLPAEDSLDSAGL